MTKFTCQSRSNSTGIRLSYYASHRENFPEFAVKEKSSLCWFICFIISSQIWVYFCRRSFPEDLEPGFKQNGGSSRTHYRHTDQWKTPETTHGRCSGKRRWKLVSTFSSVEIMSEERFLPEVQVYTSHSLSPLRAEISGNLTKFSREKLYNCNFRLIFLAADLSYFVFQCSRCSSIFLVIQSVYSINKTIFLSWAYC